MPSVIENELEALKAKSLRMTAMLRKAIPLLEVCRTHFTVVPESGTYSARTAAMCESLVDSIEAELPVDEDQQLHPEAFIVSRSLLEALIAAANGQGKPRSTALQDARNLIYGSAPVDAERIKACLAACEGVTTEWLKGQSDEANTRLRGERERRLRDEKAAPTTTEGLIAVDAAALHAVLTALTGPGYLISELQVTRMPEELFADNPINVLIKQYHAAIN